jgi:hypothetical protein
MERRGTVMAVNTLEANEILMHKLDGHSAFACGKHAATAGLQPGSGD